MAEETKSRRKKKEPERINLDEWANAGALDGLLSFLNITPEQAPVNQGSKKVLNLLEERHSVKEALPVIDTAPISDTVPVIEVPQRPTPESSAAPLPVI